jgi:hypothetical protein
MVTATRLLTAGAKRVGDDGVAGMGYRRAGEGPQERATEEAQGGAARSRLVPGRLRPERVRAIRPCRSAGPHQGGVARLHRAGVLVGAVGLVAMAPVVRALRRAVPALRARGLLLHGPQQRRHPARLDVGAARQGLGVEAAQVIKRRTSTGLPYPMADEVADGLGAQACAYLNGQASGVLLVGSLASCAGSSASSWIRKGWTDRNAARARSP